MEGSQPKKPTRSESERSHYFAGTKARWYSAWDLTDDEREVFRQTSLKSRRAKVRAANGEGRKSVHPIYAARLDPMLLMPHEKDSGLRSLSLFSGGGGLDLGFDRAGFTHVASFDILQQAADTLKRNRPKWTVYYGDAGDVRRVRWTEYSGKVDIVHAGPPCQPFSMAGRQSGADDARDMFPQFVRIVQAINPLAFVGENVPSLLSTKFEGYVQQVIVGPLSKAYDIHILHLAAASFGVPQVRNRVFFVGIRKDLNKNAWAPGKHWGCRWTVRTD